MLDEDLAELYKVPTKRLNEQVKRNALRFPEDFAFRLSEAEFEKGLTKKVNFFGQPLFYLDCWFVKKLPVFKLRSVEKEEQRGFRPFFLFMQLF